MKICIPKPWNPYRYETIKTSRHSRRGNSDYRVIYNNLTDYNKTWWKLGDLIKFDNGYNIYPVIDNWQLWCYKNSDRERYIKENCKRVQHIPLYASGQMAIILGRYRVKKFKWHGIYRDYGTVIMMLSGSSIGHIRRYYIKTPWSRLDSYPYNNNNHSELFQGVTVGNNIKVFLENLVEKIYENK
jgi:hypothetical protein